jgi:hypothetical protein
MAPEQSKRVRLNRQDFNDEYQTKPYGGFLCFVVAAVVLMAGWRLLIYYFSLSSHARPVTLDLTFRLVDSDDKPIPNFPVRYVDCSDKGWQEPDSGGQFVTDKAGEGHEAFRVILDQRWRRMPGNMLSVIWPPYRTDRDYALQAIAPDLEGGHHRKLWEKRKFTR